jgi:uncharacterized protein YhfF
MPVPPALADFWAEALARVPRLSAAHFYEDFCFGDSPRLADELAALVLQGRKRATAGLVWVFEAQHKALPGPGSLSIVKSGAEQPLCVIETTRLDLLPFDQVDAEFAYEEGEGDGTLESWRRNHQAYFARECARIGRVPQPDMPVACERFRLVYAAGDSSAATGTTSTRSASR